MTASTASTLGISGDTPPPPQVSRRINYIFSEQPDTEFGDHFPVSNDYPHTNSHLQSFILHKWTHCDTDNAARHINYRKLGGHTTTTTSIWKCNSSHYGSLKDTCVQRPTNRQQLYGVVNCIFSDNPHSNHGDHQPISNEHPQEGDHIKRLIRTWTHSGRDCFSETCFSRSGDKLSGPTPYLTTLHIPSHTSCLYSQYVHKLSLNSSPTPHPVVRRVRDSFGEVLWGPLSLKEGQGACRLDAFPCTGPGIPLFPYGSSAGDLWLPSRGVDVTSKLFKLQIGFPFGSSLRDSLYFTDDGQIIFPESDYHIFSYPNPPSQGFTRWDSVAMVAPFWDVADFSSQKGTIFYQEYETLYGEYDLLVRQVETWIQQFTNSRDYYAKWTLKITWVKVPAYPAQSTLGTNTYQAILTTDGSRSYALFLYQRGGMQWDVTQRLYSSVVIGFSSGDGHFENSPLMFQPVWKKYRPDQFLHPKLGLYGVQIYRLHREERPNFRLKCLEWLKSQPQWPRWGWSHISCPCSWQQGRWDFRFQPIHTGWWDSNSRKLCSFSSWRGGVCCSYGPWGEFREGWHVRSPWHFDQDLEPQNWCCRWNDKPFLCEQYWQRRGRISCAGYRPPRPAWTFGDPHIVTFDDANYTFNGLGDFLLARAWDRNSSFLLQGRTAQTSSANATNFIAFAAQYNSSTLGPITVQWLLDSNNTIQVLHNHHNVTFETNNVDAEGLHIFNTTGLLLTRNGSQVSASFDGTVTITVVALSNILHASSSLPEEYQNHTEGLLGVWNNNPEDDFKMPNGSTIPRNSSEDMLYHYGMTWQTNGTDLLGKRTDSLPSNFTPVFLSQLSMRNNTSLASECNENIPCIYDTLITGNTDTGRHTRMASENYRQMNASLNQKPPSINGPRRIEAYKEKTKKIQFSSNSENITFTLRDQCSDFKLFENGTFLWTPTSLRPCTVEILARDSRTGLTSALQLQAVVCFCNAESQCFFNQTRWVDNSFLEVASCKCDGDSFGLSCEHTKDPCDQQCFPNVRCVRGKGCEACPPNMTGDGRHCAALEDLFHCANHSCPVNYCYNQGHCYISRTPDCQPSCICPPAFTDNQCFLAGNSFTPAVYGDLPLRVIHLTLREGDNASAADVNASVAYRLETLEVRAFLRNSQVQSISQSILAPGRTIQHWLVTSEFQYRAKGPVIHFLNNQLQEAIVELFLQAPRGRHKRNEEPRNNVFFYPISKEDVHDGIAVNLSTLETYFKCDGYKGYRLVYDPQRGFTCVSPCGENYCHHGGQCQHLPDGPRCSCLSFSIYTSWGERCERLSVKLGAFLGILFGALGALSLLGVGVLLERQAQGSRLEVEDSGAGWTWSTFTSALSHSVVGSPDLQAPPAPAPRTKPATGSSSLPCWDLAKIMD
ncbi:mucin-4 [Thomomys bottae]